MICFDLDGTLLDSNWVWLEIDRTFLGRFGVSPIPMDYAEYCAHHAFPEAARYTRERFSLSLSEEEIMAVWQDMARQAYSSTLPMKSGARELLERLDHQGVPMCLITSCIPTLCRAALDHHGIHRYFRRVFTVTEMGLEKGDTALYRRVEEELALSPAACTLVDDNPLCCAAAARAGWRVMGVDDPLFRHRREELLHCCSAFGDRLSQLPLP